MLLFLFILVMMMTKFEKSDLCLRLADKMDRMDRSRERFIMILITKARNMSQDSIALTKCLLSLVYYLVIALAAFLLTRDNPSEEEIAWQTGMEVPWYKKHILEAFTVFLISLIGFKNFVYFDFSPKNIWVIMSVVFYLYMLLFGLLSHYIPMPPDYSGDEGVYLYV